MEHFYMELESKSGNEEFARVTAAVFASRLNPTLEEMNDIKTAVSEAFTNAEIHGYQKQCGVVRLYMMMEGRELTIKIVDDGIGIPDVPRAMEPLYTTDLTGERSGMGFSFMEAFMDSVQVDSSPGIGTSVTMKKFIGR